MRSMVLARVGSSDRGTFGVLRVGHVPFAVTCERPWKDNARNLSCIPAGTYTCTRVRSPKFGDTFEVTRVPGRSHILFHKGNDIEDTEGCILVGEEFSGTWDRPMIVSSQRGFYEFNQAAGTGPSFTLHILDPVKEPSDVHQSV